MSGPSASAGEALQAAVMVALEGVPDLGAIYPGPPLQAAAPYAVVDAGLQSDWSHKSGAGREVRLAVSIYDQGERPGRLHRLAAEAETALAGLAGELPSVAGPAEWRLVTMYFVRSRVVRAPKSGWAAVIEFRARLLLL